MTKLRNIQIVASIICLALLVISLILKADVLDIPFTNTFHIVNLICGIALHILLLYIFTINYRIHNTGAALTALILTAVLAIVFVIKQYYLFQYYHLLAIPNCFVSASKFIDVSWAYNFILFIAVAFFAESQRRNTLILCTSIIIMAFSYLVIIVDGIQLVFGWGWVFGYYRGDTQYYLRLGEYICMILFIISANTMYKTINK